MATSDQIWAKLLEIGTGMGDLKAEVASCSVRIGTLARHQAAQNGNVAHIMDRLVAIELANAEDCGEENGKRHWGRIAAWVTGIVLAAAIGIGDIIAQIWG